MGAEDQKSQQGIDPQKLLIKRMIFTEQAVAEETKNMPQDIVEKVLQGHRLTEDEAKERDPYGDLPVRLIQAEARKKVALTLHNFEKDLPESLQDVIESADIEKYYDYRIANKNLQGHVEISHGVKPTPEISKWCEEHKVVDWDEETDKIGKAAQNFMFFKKPRIEADVNSLRNDKAATMLSEKTVFTGEYNIHGIKCERDLTKRLLKETNNLDEQKKAKNPYLAVHLHGKADSRGHDFEIAARQFGEKGPLNPLLAFWLKEKIQEKINQKEIKNKKGETASVGVVSSPGPYSGSPALTRLRHGDDLFDFKGFGENFQALQLECGNYIRHNHPEGLTQIINELIEDFTKEFKKTEDLKKLEKYQEQYKENLQREKNSTLRADKVQYTDSIKPGRIALRESVRDYLGVELGGELKLGDTTLKVVKMPMDALKSGFTMCVNSGLKDTFFPLLQNYRAGSQE